MEDPVWMSREEQTLILYLALLSAEWYFGGQWCDYRVRDHLHGDDGMPSRVLMWYVNGSLSGSRVFTELIIYSFMWLHVGFSCDSNREWIKLQYFSYFGLDWDLVTNPEKGLCPFPTQGHELRCADFYSSCFGLSASRSNESWTGEDISSVPEGHEQIQWLRSIMRESDSPWKHVRNVDRALTPALGYWVKGPVPQPLV